MQSPSAFVGLANKLWEPSGVFLVSAIGFPPIQMHRADDATFGSASAFFVCIDIGHDLVHVAFHQRRVRLRGKTAYFIPGAFGLIRRSVPDHWIDIHLPQGLTQLHDRRS